MGARFGRFLAISAALGFYTIPVMLYPFLMLVIWGRRKAILPATGEKVTQMRQEALLA